MGKIPHLSQHCAERMFKLVCSENLIKFVPQKGSFIVQSQFLYSAGTQDSVKASRLQVSDDHRNTKSKSKNIQRGDGHSHKMIKKEVTNQY